MNVFIKLTGNGKCIVKVWFFETVISSVQSLICVQLFATP